MKRRQKNMKCALTKKVIENVKETIHSQEFLKKAKTKESAFSRNRKLSFCDIITFMITTSKKCLQTELNIFCKKTGRGNVTRQAFSKARENIKPEAIKELNENISKQIERDARLKTYRGYRLISVDGSVLDLPSNEKLKEHFGYSTNGTDVSHTAAMAMIAYDVLNNIALWGELYSYYDSEKKRIYDVIDEIKNRETTENPLFLLDRGYPSFELIYRLSENKQNYLIRVSSNSLKEINEATQEDQTISITRNDKQISLRVVNIKLSNNVTEKLLTNLDETFTTEDFKALYAKRWRIETSYHYIKNSQLLECFTGESITAIYQDFYISLVVMNIAATMYMEQIREIEKHVDYRQLRYNPSFSALIFNIKNDFAKYLTSEKMKSNFIKQYFQYKSIMQFAYAVVPDRSRVRRSSQQSKFKGHRKNIL